MDDYDIDLEDKNVVGSIDRSIVNFGLVFLALVPTYFHLIFNPKSFVTLLRGEAIDGREGLRLGPGITFVFTILVLLGVGYLVRGLVSPVEIAGETGEPSSGIRSAVSEGNLWRSIIMSLPLYFAALLLGVIVHFSHVFVRRKSDITQAVGIGLYALSTLLLLIIPIGISAEGLVSESMQPGVIGAMVVIGIFAVLPWQIFSFSKHAFGNSAKVAIAAAGISLVLVFLALSCMGLVVSAVTGSR